MALFSSKKWRNRFVQTGKYLFVISGVQWTKDSFLFVYVQFVVPYFDDDDLGPTKMGKKSHIVLYLGSTSFTFIFHYCHYWNWNKLDFILLCWTCKVGLWHWPPGVVVLHVLRSEALGPIPQTQFGHNTTAVKNRAIWDAFILGTK